MTELTAAVVGCGYGAGVNHAAGYREAEGVELVAVCDLDADRARALAAEHDVPWYEDADAMFVDHSPDLVSVATPEHLHVEPTITALEAGSHVLCEKIMAHSLETGREMVAAAGRADRVLGVDYNYRHMPVFERIDRAIAAGEIGDVSLVSLDVHSFCWHHAIDLLRCWLGKPSAVTASIERDPAEDFWDYHDELCYVPSPVGCATFEFDGTLASLSATRRADLEEHLIDVAVYGEDGRIVVRDIALEDTTGTPGPGPIADDLRDLPSISLSESFHRSIQAFVDALRADERPPTTGEDGLAMLELEAATVDSDAEGRRIEP